MYKVENNSKDKNVFTINKKEIQLNAAGKMSTAMDCVRAGTGIIDNKAKSCKKENKKIQKNIKDICNGGDPYKY